jgi:polyhydroxybutyrate depolymerase
MSPSLAMKVRVGDRDRTYGLVGGRTTNDRALVLVFHGSRQTGEVHRRFTGGALDALAESGTAVVAYLDGYRGNWNDARKESFFPARVENVDDVAFTRRVIADLVATHDVDARRVYAVGYSNGGQMVLRLLHETPELFAGAVVVAATMPDRGSFLAPTPAPEPVPVPVLLVHGTKDPIVPYRGGPFPGWARRFFKVGGSTLSAPATARYFARRHGITGDPVVTRLTPEGRARAGTWVEQTDYREEGHAPVRLLTVHGGGHTVPGPRRAPFVLGRTARGASVAGYLAELFGLGIVPGEPAGSGPAV